MNDEVKEENVVIQSEVKLAGTVTIPSGVAGDREYDPYFEMLGWRDGCF